MVVPMIIFIDKIRHLVSHLPEVAWNAIFYDLQVPDGR